MTLIIIWGTPWPQIWTELDEIFTTDSQELRSKFKITADDVVHCITRKLELFDIFEKATYVGVRTCPVALMQQT